MRNTFTRVRKPDWPATFDDAMADPIISRLIEIYARHQIPAVCRITTPTGKHLTPPLRSPRTPWVSRYPRPLAAGEVDVKRKAAGDFDDSK